MQPSIHRNDGSHWYYPTGEPCYELPKKDGKGTKTPTLADARKLNLVPGVSNILRVLHKPQLQEWLTKQAVLAVLTSPKRDDESLDDYVQRVLYEERVQDEEAQKARDKGTEIHGALEKYFSFRLIKTLEITPDLVPWIAPAATALLAYVEMSDNAYENFCEQYVVGRGYGGRLDLMLVHRTKDVIWLWDYKTASKLPKGEAWPEHQLQLAAYAGAVEEGLVNRDPAKETLPTIRVGNLYISTTEQGAYAIIPHDDWKTTYQNAFMPLVTYWQWANQYYPNGNKPVPILPDAGKALG